MTTIRVGVTRPGPDGGLHQIGGHIKFTPWRRTTNAPIEPTDVVLPLPITAFMRADQPPPLIELDPRWLWQAREHFPTGLSRLLLIPPSPETVDYADLAWVDPRTLPPNCSPDEAWWAAYWALAEQVENIWEIIDAGGGGGGTTPPATTTSLGTIRLANALTGTALNPELADGPDLTLIFDNHLI